MKPKTLVLMGVAIACGLGASYMTSRLLAERQSDDEPKVTVLVAKKTLNFGDTIKVPEDLFTEKKFTRGDEPPGAVETYEALKNRVLKRPLRPGDHVTSDDLIGDGNDDTMSVKVPIGFRAIGVKVNPVSVASGWASLPLSRVDIVLTVRGNNPAGSFSKIILENVLVLAADASMVRPQDGKPMPAQVVTVALKPEDAIKVTLASAMGELQLFLRKINDSASASQNEITGDGLKGGSPSRFDDPIETPTPPVVAKVEPKIEPKVEPAKPAEPPADPPVTEPKEPLTRHVLEITEGGRSRFVEYYLNAEGQVVDGEATTQRKTGADPK